MHARAAWERWREESPLLFEEQRRVALSFVWTSGQWLERSEDGAVPRADTIDERILEGRKTYCIKQARRYLALAKEASENFREMEKLKPMSKAERATVLPSELVRAKVLELELRCN